MKQTNISTLALNEVFNRLIIESHNGSIKFFDVDHLRFDSEVDNEHQSQFRGDSIDIIVLIAEIPIIITSHKSSNNKIVIIPPSGFKYHQFGHFRKMNKRDIYEIESCILLLFLLNKLIDYSLEINLVLFIVIILKKYLIL